MRLSLSLWRPQGDITKNVLHHKFSFQEYTSILQGILHLCKVCSISAKHILFPQSISYFHNPFCKIYLSLQGIFSSDFFSAKQMLLLLKSTHVHGWKWHFVICYDQSFAGGKECTTRVGGWGGGGGGGGGLLIFPYGENYSSQQKFPCWEKYITVNRYIIQEKISFTISFQASTGTTSVIKKIWL